VQNYGYPGWGDTLSTGAAYNVYVFWVNEQKTVRQQLSELCPPNKSNPDIIVSNYSGINYNYDTYMFGACTAAGTCDSTTPDDISKELLNGIKANKKCNWNRFNEGNYFYNTSPEGWAKTDCKKFWYDTGAPHMQWGCMQQLWQEAGCTTVMNDADKTLREKYFSLNTTDIKKSMKAIATATDSDNRTKCYGADKSKWPSVVPAPVPAPAPAPVPAPAPAPKDPYHLTQVAGVSWMSSLQYAQSQGGRLPTFAEAIAYIQKVGKALVPDTNQWVAVTNGLNNEYDWIEISGAPSPYPLGSSLVGAVGKSVFGVWYNAPTSNNWVLWVS
jgi:hypothetical protein